MHYLSHPSEILGELDEINWEKGSQFVQKIFQIQRSSGLIRD